MQLLACSLASSSTPGRKALVLSPNARCRVAPSSPTSFTSPLEAMPNFESSLPQTHAVLFSEHQMGSSPYDIVPAVFRDKPVKRRRRSSLKALR